MSNPGASNENDSQIKRRWLPRELQCEIVRALPFHSSRRMLLVSGPIATNCVESVRKQKQKFENRWDPTACHAGLTLIEPERLMVKFNGNHREVLRYVFAERPIPKNGIFYFEMNILNDKSGAAIGLAPLNNFNGMYAFRSRDCFGRSAAASRWPNQRPTFDAGDVIGCGVNLATRQRIYTRDGERLDTTNLFVPDSADDLFPFVMLSKRGDKIEANFGPNFSFNIAEVINRFYGISS
uniref:B30.2/SPRY domain-containing protein n=1 Tax=Globodera rostochiensis TaxID=31243 RepID=A0A914HEL9_GLORO